jgi:hypothetical protein
MLESTAPAQAGQPAGLDGSGRTMAQRADETTWLEDKRDMITLVNRSKNNYILELPAGRYRLDAGRSMLTLKSMLDFDPIKRLVDEGSLAVEQPAK